MTQLMTPTDLQKIVDDADMAKAREYLKYAKAKEGEEQHLHELFVGRTIHPEVKERVNAAVRRAAENGRNEIEVITFPSSYCKDGGRRINNNEPDWPNSLDGFAKKAYDYFDKELRPLGYKLRVQVIDYPGGMPGNIGMYLRW